MRIIFIVSLSFILINCSFDNKTGIWKNENTSLDDKEDKIFSDFKKISISAEQFKEIIIFNGNLASDITDPVRVNNWKDIFFDSNNSLNNFEYSNLNEIVLKSPKLSKKKLNRYKLFENGNLITSDEKGNLIIFSLKKNKIIFKFNFYKKKYKKINKKLNLIVERNIVYVTDNLGYAYALNYKDNKIIWAKNYKIPFNSNLKIFKNKIATSNQNNNLFIINKKNGDLLKSIPTEEFFIKNQFTNNLSRNRIAELFFLNSFGSLYSINLNSMEVNWFNNFNQSTNLTTSNLFDGNIIVNSERIVLVSSNDNTYLINSSTGSVIKKFNFSTKIRPVIIKNHVFLLTKNYYLISIDLNSNDILYSYYIGEIAEGSKKKIKDFIIKDLMILNNGIFIFLDNSKVINFDINGKFKKILKLPSKIYSSPISIQGSIFYLNNKKNLIVLN